MRNLDIRGQIQLDVHKYKFKDIFDVCQRVNGPLPVYHPQFLQQAILAGRIITLNAGSSVRKASACQGLAREIGTKSDQNR